MTEERKKIFDKVKQLNENEQYDAAVEAVKEMIALDEQISNQEVELISWVINNKTTR